MLYEGLDLLQRKMQVVNKNPNLLENNPVCLGFNGARATLIIQYVVVLKTTAL